MSTHSPFNLGEPLAFFVTWTTYGTWLPGDNRGWRRSGKPGAQAPNPFFAEMARSLMKETEFTLSPEDRLLVEVTIRQHCAIRRWALHAVNARTNHVHVVVTAPGYKPEKVRDQFKAWCTRRLKEMGAGRTRFWTEGGDCRQIDDEASLENAVVYVLEAQDRKGRDEIP
jgi:REP element-mobilizing transposase RayT